MLNRKINIQRNSKPRIMELPSRPKPYEAKGLPFDHVSTKLIPEKIIWDWTIYVAQSSESSLFNYGFQNILYLDLFGRTTSVTLGWFSCHNRFWFARGMGENRMELNDLCSTEFWKLTDHGFQNILYLDLFGRMTSVTLRWLSCRKIL